MKDESSAFLSRRRLMEASGLLLPLAALPLEACSSQGLNQQHKFVITSPDYLYLESSIASGNAKAGALLCTLDTTLLQIKIIELKSALEMNAKAADRLTDDYLNNFIYASLNAQISIAKKTYDATNEVFEHVLGGARIGAQTLFEIEDSRATNDKAQISLNKANFAKTHKIAEIEVARAENLAERENITGKINLYSSIISSRSIECPFDCAVTQYTLSGMFVAKDKVLFGLDP